MNPHGNHLRENVLDARERLAEGRAKIKTLHARGGTGKQVCTKLSTLVDSIVLRLYNQALDDLGDTTAETIHRNVALVAIGGYGRRQLAPFSDVDLMILYRGQGTDAVRQLARRLTQDIFDAGLVLGHSVRTVAESIRLVREDGQVATALIESRLLAGEQQLHEQLAERFTRLVKRRGPMLAGLVIDARAKERDQFGETVPTVAKKACFGFIKCFAARLKPQSKAFRQVSLLVQFGGR